ncbi:MAG TPA: sugar ABC transporter permease [Feifaniaceae bacterium]|nr:sugar ABC transporter permease [Feifaniaceae bacterium]
MSLTQRQKRRAVTGVKVVSLQVFFIALCFVTLIPILYALSVSFNANNSLLSADFSFVPKAFTLANYKAVFTEKPVLLWFKNSVFIAVCTVTIALSVSIPSAYAFSRMRFRGRKTLLNMLILLNAFPSLLSMFAIYKLMNPIGLVDSRLGLIIIYTGTMAVFGLWNMKGYFDTIPYDIEEAARIDGASELQIIRRIVIPLAKPSIIVTAVMVLIYVWNEYIYAVTFMTGSENFTLATGLYSLQAGEMSGSWPVFAAASLVISLPVLIIFLYVQRHMVSGLTAGGVKG